MRIDLSGSVALVTGAARGIGRAVAEAFAEAGAELALVDRDPIDLDGRVGTFDVRDPEAIEGFVGGLDRLDIVVNNAGGTYRAPFAESSPKGDEALIRENLLSAAWVTRAALPVLADGGAIVNITTIEASRAAPGFAVYAAAKAGLENLTRSLAVELGDRGIRVNAIAPDVIPTPGVPGLPDPPRTPLRHRPTPADVANVALFLASPLAAFVTGAVIPVDGGNLAAAGWRRGADGTWSPS